MTPRIALLAVIAATLSLVSLASTARAAPHFSVTTGTVLGYDPESTLLSINGPLGVKRFLVNSSTVILLNNHSATTQGIQEGDRVEVTYRFDTSVAKIVHLFRQNRLRGKIFSVNNTTVAFRIKQANFNLTSNAQSEVTIAGLPVDDLDVLPGLTGKAIYEPGNQNLLLQLEVDGKVRKGTLAAVDILNSTLTLAESSRVWPVLTAATIYRDGEVTTLGALQAGDRIRAAQVRLPGAQQLAVIVATSSP